MNSSSAASAPSRADPQTLLLRQLEDLLTHGPADLDALLQRIVAGLSRSCAVRAARIVPAGAPDSPPAPQPGGPGALLLPLRLLGEDLGLLVLDAPGPPPLRPEVAHALAHHTAVVVKATAVRRDRALDTAAADAVRRLFEEGTRAASVRAAGEVLARVAVAVLGAERVAVHLADPEGRVHDLLDVGVPPDVAQALRHQVVGRRADDSPVWRQAQREGGPVLAEDAATNPGRPGGFIQTMKLRSYVAMPLLSAAGAVGMIVAGDVSGPRAWTERDRRVAQHLALQGALVVDSARLRQAERAHLADLRHRADHDPLTGLPNRARLLHDLQAALPSPAGALLLLDLDGFKQVNDTFGHHAGDELLREVAHRLRRGVRDVDLTARLGGDEFAVLVADATPAQAADLADRLGTALRAPVQLEDAVARVGVSIGTALLPEHGHDVTALVRAADTAMYRSKRRRHARPARAHEPGRV